MLVKKRTLPITETKEYQELLREYRIKYFLWSESGRFTKARKQYWLEYIEAREKLLSLVEKYRQVGISVEDSL